MSPVKLTSVPISISPPDSGEGRPTEPNSVGNAVNDGEADTEPPSPFEHDWDNILPLASQLSASASIPGSPPHSRQSSPSHSRRSSLSSRTSSITPSPTPVTRTPSPESSPSPFPESSDDEAGVEDGGRDGLEEVVVGKEGEGEERLETPCPSPRPQFRGEAGEAGEVGTRRHETLNDNVGQERADYRGAISVDGAMTQAPMTQEAEPGKDNRQTVVVDHIDQPPLPRIRAREGSSDMEWTPCPSPRPYDPPTVRDSPDITKDEGSEGDPDSGLSPREPTPRPTSLCPHPTPQAALEGDEGDARPGGSVVGDNRPEDRLPTASCASSPAGLEWTPCPSPRPRSPIETTPRHQEAPRDGEREVLAVGAQEEEIQETEEAEGESELETLPSDSEMDWTPCPSPRPHPPPHPPAPDAAEDEDQADHAVWVAQSSEMEWTPCPSPRREVFFTPQSIFSTPSATGRGGTDDEEVTPKQRDGADKEEVTPTARRVRDEEEEEVTPVAPPTALDSRHSSQSRQSSMDSTPCPSPRVERFYTPSSRLTLTLSPTTPTRFFTPEEPSSAAVSELLRSPRPLSTALHEDEVGLGQEVGQEYATPEQIGQEVVSPGTSRPTSQPRSATPSTVVLEPLPTSSPQRAEASHLDSRLDSQLDRPSEPHATSERLSDHVLRTDGRSDHPQTEGIDGALDLPDFDYLSPSEEDEEDELDFDLDTSTRPTLTSAYPTDLPAPIKGFHVSSDGGLAALAARARSLRSVPGPVGVQCFTGSPRRHKHLRVEEDEVRDFRRGTGGREGRRWWTVHANHTTNLASADE